MPTRQRGSSDAGLHLHAAGGIDWSIGGMWAELSFFTWDDGGGQDRRNCGGRCFGADGGKSMVWLLDAVVKERHNEASMYKIFQN
jgi:hypothetical protein